VVVGVTGSVGTGKSTVAQMFSALGAVVIDADRLAHEVMEPKRLAWRRIVRTFGSEIVNDDQTINRKALADRVFQDERARRALEAIVHPPVIRRVKQHLRRLSRNRRIRMVVLDVPLLVETGTDALVDALVVVTAPVHVQQNRLIKRGWSAAEAARRTSAQWDLSAKAALADYVVDNADGFAHTRRQVREVWKRLLETRHRRHA